MLVTGPLTRLCSMATCLLRPLTKLTQNSTQSENFDSLTLRYGIVNYIIMCMFGREGPKPYTCTSNVYLASLVSCHQGWSQVLWYLYLSTISTDCNVLYLVFNPILGKQ